MGYSQTIYAFCTIFTVQIENFQNPMQDVKFHNMHVTNMFPKQHDGYYVCINFESFI